MADLEARKIAQEEHARTTGGLYQQREELMVTRPQAARELGDLNKELEVRLASLHQRAMEIDEAIYSADNRLKTFLHDPHSTSS